MSQNKLNELYQLKMKGLINDEEFKRMEAELLTRQKEQQVAGQQLTLEKKAAYNKARAKAMREANPFLMYVKCWKHFFDFFGRAKRTEYWSFNLINLFISIFFISSNEANIGLDDLFLLVIFIPSLAVLVRRLHDTGRSGKIILAPIFCILLAFATIYIPPLAILFGLVAGVINIYIFVLTFLPSIPDTDEE